jgi:protein ImuB
VIPSYDDLTPGIPDVVDSETVDQLALFLREDLHKTPRAKATAKPAERKVDQPASTNTALFACLRLRELAVSKATASSDPAAFTTVLPRQALLAVARDFSPRVMQASESEVLVDVSGLGRLIGEPPEIARQLARAMYDAGLAASVAIAGTQTMARLLATQLPEYPIARFPDLSVNYLRPLEIVPPGMPERDRTRPYEIFEKWGIATLADLAALPAAELSSRLGRRGVALQRLARGLDARPFVPDAETPRYIGRLELEWPIDALEPLSFVFARLLEPLSLSLERADRGAAAVHLELRLTDRSTHTRLLQLPAPMRDPRVLRTLLLLDLESHAPAPLGGAGEANSVTSAVDVVTIELDPAPARITQFSLLQRALPSPETLSTLTARLSALVGESRVGSPVLLDTHAPDAFAMKGYAPDGPASARGTDGAKGALTLRRQRVPPAIRVSVESGRPVYIASSKRGMPHGAVVQAAGPWRASGGWWPSDVRSDAEWNRDEWDVALASGVVCRIFQDRTTERWFLEGLYD